MSWPWRGGGVAAAVSLAVVAGLIAAGSPLLAMPPPVPLGSTDPNAGPSSSAPVAVAPAFQRTPATRDLGAMPADSEVTVAVALALRDPAGLHARVALEYVPGSPSYHDFLTPAQVTDTYGPTPSQYASATEYFLGAGLRVQTSPDRLLLVVSGSSEKVADAFHTSFEIYGRDGRTFYSHPTPATLPPGPPWAGVIGLGNATVPTFDAHRAAGTHPLPLTGCGSANGALTPCQVQSVYNLSGFLGAGINGTGYRIGVVDTYDGSESQSQLQSDLAGFSSANALSVGTVNYLYPVPTSKNLNATSTGWGLEESLDLEWARAMAPGATIDMTFAPDSSAGLYASVDWLVAHHAVDVLSLSWGEPDVGIYNAYAMPCTSQCNASSDGTYSMLLPVLAAAAAEGIGVFSSSGDCGAADGTNGFSTGYPASDPSVTGVGGTILSVGSGNSYGAEQGWSGSQSGGTAPGCQNQGGSGGGFAPFPRPGWQSATGLPSNDSRGVPDVAIIGGSAVSIVYQGNGAAVLGTSEGTPIWAALEAIADQRAGGPLGSLNPSLYAIARSGSYASDFHDVTTGNNGYGAGPGWDAVTGLGSPNAAALVPALLALPPGPSTLHAYIGATPRFVAVGGNVSFDASATGGRSPFASFDLSFGDGNASWTNGTSAVHAYARPGVYAASAVVFDAVANTSVSAPVAVVVGGGGALNVSLVANASAPGVGAPVDFQATAVGGSGAYRYSYFFGDGTYLTNSTSTSVVHAFGAPGGYCAAVVASDVSQPPDGGGSSAVGISVGSVASPPCGVPGPLIANASSAITAADLPADFPFQTTAQGGSPPYSVQYTSDDPYVRACECGIFRTVGTHRVTVYVNDSLNQEVQRSLTVTTYPALVAEFSVSGQVGAAPFSVTFHASAAGGTGTNAGMTRWTFGDGGSAVGSTVVHMYSTAGRFVASAHLEDRGHGNASELFGMVATSGASPFSALSFTVSSAIDAYANAPIHFHAGVTGNPGTLQVTWAVSPPASLVIYPVNATPFSGYGSDLNESFDSSDCYSGTMGGAACAIPISLAARNSTGNLGVWQFNITLGSRASGLSVLAGLNTFQGATPSSIRGWSVPTGMPSFRSAWTLGDGSTAQGSTFQHLFTTPGAYTVMENTTDGFGDYFLRDFGLNLTGSTGSGLHAAGAPNPAEGLAPLAVTFNVTGEGGSGAPYGYQWEFGDGSNGSSTASPVHVYSQPGRYEANVTVTDSHNDSGTSTFPVVVNAVTPVALTLNASTADPSALHLSASIAYVCSSLSVRNCSSESVVVDLGYEGPLVAGGAGPSTSGGPWVIAFAPAGPNGHGFSTVNTTLPYPAHAPGLPMGGNAVLYASVAGPNFSGAAQVEFTPPPGTLFPPTVGATIFLISAATLGVLVAVAVLLRSRRPSGPIP